MPTIVTTGVLIFQQDKVLLVKHGESSGHVNGVYGIPGGHIEENESLKQAAVRECKEETGLIIEEKDLEEFPDNEYAADIVRKDGVTKRYAMHLFLVRQFSGGTKGNSETVPEWVRIEDLSQLNLLLMWKKQCVL